MDSENNRVLYSHNTLDFRGFMAFLAECPRVVCAYYSGDTSEAGRDLEDPINESPVIAEWR